MTGGIPHAAIRLSNVGDYRLTFRGVEWDGESDEGVFIGYAKPRAWNDVKVLAKMSLGGDGIFKVWLDGKGQHGVEVSGEAEVDANDGKDERIDKDAGGQGW